MGKQTKADGIVGGDEDLVAMAVSGDLDRVPTRAMVGARARGLGASVSLAVH